MVVGSQMQLNHTGIIQLLWDNSVLQVTQLPGSIALTSELGA